MASSQGQGGPKYCKCKKMSTPTSLVLLFECTEAKCGKGLFLIYKLTVLPQILLLLHANQHVTCPDPQGGQRHYHHLWMFTVHSLPSLQSRHLRRKISARGQLHSHMAHNCSGSLSSAVPSLLQCYCSGIPTKDSTKKKDIGTFF